MEQQDNSKQYLWYAVIALAIILGLVLFFGLNKTDELEGKNKVLTENAKQDAILLDVYREQKKISDKEIDSLSSIISVVKETKEDEQVNKQGNEKIRTINLYTPSEQQAYFDSVATDYIRKQANKRSNSR